MLVTIGDQAIPLEGIRRVRAEGKHVVVNYHDGDAIIFKPHEVRRIGGFDVIVKCINDALTPPAQTAAADSSQTPPSAASAEASRSA